MSASVGINDSCPTANIKFGRVKINKESFPRDFPVINPSVMPVKGIVFAKGDIGPYISKKTFALDRGEEQSVMLNAYAPNGSKNGSFAGDIMMYSSPFWLIIPDIILESVFNINAEATVFILDLMSAVILTFLTLILLVSITFIGDKTNDLLIDKSWQYPVLMGLGKNITKNLLTFKKKIKVGFSKNIGWVLKIEISNEKENISSIITKPAIASLILIPIIYILEEQIAAMIISIIFAGLIAYFISCKLRKKIIMTVIITGAFAVLYMIIKSNMIIVGKEGDIIRLLSLSIGVIGLYMLIFTLALIPLTLIVWKIVSYMRNVKEEKEPLLYLEGKCDL
jgi:hypothetical protein